MAIIIIATLMILFNVIMWIIFANKFNKIFSTDEIISKTREELNSMLSDINRNADRNITLIEDRIRQLKAITSEADRNLSILRAELDKTEKTQIMKDKMSAVSYSVDESRTTYKIPERNRVLNASTSLDKYIKEKNKGESNKKQIHNDVHNAAEVKEEKEFPKIIASANPIIPKKDFNTQVKELAAQGKTIEEIASELDRSTQEVKFTLEIS